MKALPSRNKREGKLSLSHNMGRCQWVTGRYNRQLRKRLQRAYPNVLPDARIHFHGQDHTYHTGN